MNYSLAEVLCPALTRATLFEPHGESLCFNVIVSDESLKSTRKLLAEKIKHKFGREHR